MLFDMTAGNDLSANGIPLAELDAEGVYVQGTCYIVPKRLQALVKYDMFDPNTDASGDSTDTWTLGLNYYLKGHDLKLQLNYLLEDSPGIAHRQSKFLVRVQTIF